jgi:thiosulfate reductase cytochrome b subunit
MQEMPEAKLVLPQVSPGRFFIKRHSILTRITHWVNVLCLTLLLMSGLQIFNAHSALDWGSSSNFENPIISVGTFPGWATIPSYQDLGGGRLWHFFFAWVFFINGAIYLSAAILSRHLSRDLIPTLAAMKQIGHSLLEHARLRFPKGEEAKHYNVIQQLAYLAVIFGLLPLAIATGLCMSPRLDADFHWLPELFGGRQSARTLHFMAAAGLLSFTLIHIVMVLISGVGNNLRSMITGRYAIEMESTDAETGRH